MACSACLCTVLVYLARFGFGRGFGLGFFALPSSSLCHNHSSPRLCQRKYLVVTTRTWEGKTLGDLLACVVAITRAGWRAGWPVPLCT